MVSVSHFKESCATHRDSRSISAFPVVDPVPSSRHLLLPVVHSPESLMDQQQDQVRVQMVHRVGKMKRSLVRSLLVLAVHHFALDVAALNLKAELALLRDRWELLLARLEQESLRALMIWLG